MRESGFIGQNKKKWNHFEELLNADESDAQQLSELFIHVTDDLSYARTFYPNRSVRVYLNNLAQRVFTKIYRNRRTRIGKLLNFWKLELPRAVYDARREFRLAFAIFTLAFSIGVLSSIYDPEFTASILGNHYVEMTKANIESGDPMAVYKNGNQLDMTLQITMNNLMVAFYTFIMGVFMSIGSAAILLYNGIMVGTFQYFFIERGYTAESMLAIWLHGTLEISAIIIAGAAGLVLGRGLLFPGTYSRAQAFLLSAKRALKIMLGITPVIILAAIIESFLTRYTDTHFLFRGGLIAASLIFILGYFVWYPWALAKKGFNGYVPEERLPPSQHYTISFDAIKTNSEIFKETFVLVKKYFTTLLLVAIPLSLVYTLCLFFIHYSQGLEDYKKYQEFPFYLFSYFSHAGNWPLFALNTFFTAVLLTTSHFLVINYFHTNAAQDFKRSKFLLAHGWKSLVFAVLLNSCFLLKSGLSVLVLLAIFSITVLWHFVSAFEKRGLGSSLKRTFSLISGNFGHLLGVFLVFTVVSSLFFFIFNAPIFGFYMEFIGWNLSTGENTSIWLMWLLLTALTFVAIALVLPLLMISIGLLYFSLKETNEATTLRQKISQIGKSSKFSAHA